MIKIFGVGRGKRCEDVVEGDPVETPVKKRQPGEIRMQKELEDMELPPQVGMTLVDMSFLFLFLFLV